MSDPPEETPSTLVREDDVVAHTTGPLPKGLLFRAGYHVGTATTPGERMRQTGSEGARVRNENTATPREGRRA